MTLEEIIQTTEAKLADIQRFHEAQSKDNPNGYTIYGEIVMLDEILPMILSLAKEIKDLKNNLVAGGC